MTDKEKAKAYDEAIKRGLDYIRQTPATEMVTRQDVFEAIFPEYAESKDEKIREEMIQYFTEMKKGGSAALPYDDCIAYLEKQKYDRMQPIYDNQESFESALDKAWKSYNDSGARTVDGCEDNYTECAYAKGFREGYLFGLGKYKNLDKMIVVSPEVWDNAISDAYENGKKDEEKQKPIPANSVGLKEQKSAKWSEEDEARIERIAAFMWRNRKGDTDDIFLQEQDVAWLKSLRPSWKPSEEQMKAIKHAYNSFQNDCSTKANLRLLYYDLEKLM